MLGLIRKIALYRVVIFTFFVSSTSISNAQDWLTAYNNSVELYNQGNSENALEEARRSESLYSKQYSTDHNNYRAILRQLSVICYDINELKTGINYARKEVNSWRSTTSVDELTYIDALDNLGVLYSGNQQYDSAILVLQEAIRMAALHTDYDAYEMAMKTAHLADAMYGGSNLQESEALFENAFAVLDQSEELPAEYLSFCYSYGKVTNSLKHYQKSVPYLEIMLDNYPPEYNNQPVVLDALNELGKAETELKQYTKGEAHLREVRSRLDGKDAKILFVSNTKLLADNLERQGNHAEAEALLKESGSVIDEGSDQAAMLKANQATVLLNGGKYAEAVAMFNSALETIRSTEPIDYLALGNISYNAAVANRLMGNTEEAKKHYLEAFDVSPPNSAILQKARVGYSRLLVTEGKIAEAKKIIDEVDLSDIHSWRDTEIAGIYNDLAGFYQSIASYDKATEFYQNALSNISFTTNAQLYNNTAFNYVTLLQASGNFDEAELVLSEIESTLKSSDPSLIFIFLQNAGSLYHSKGNLTQAEIQYDKALRLASQTYGEKSNQYADILLRKASLLKDKGEYEASEPLFKQVLKLVESSEGANTANYAGILNNLGILYQSMGRLDEAKKQFEKALSIYQNATTSNPSDYVLTEENLATLYSLKGENEKALKLLSQTVEGNRKIYGSESPNYATSLHNYASQLQKLGKNEDARKLFEQALAIQKTSLGTNHPSYANTLHNLAILAEDNKEYALADSLLNEVMRIRANLYAENHPSYTSGLFSRAVLRQQMDDYENAKIDFDHVAQLYLQQVVKYFPTLSEKEKTAFYKKITPVFNRYKEFLLEYYVNYKKDESVLEQLYNIQIATKAILLNSVNKTRERILSSGNSQLINDFNEWRSLKEQLATYYTYSKSKLQDDNINVEQLEELANDKEKRLSESSELFANEFDKRQLKWEDIKNTLSDDQVAIELMRVDRNPNEKLDSVTYIALAISPRFDYPQLVIYPNGDKLESRYMYAYTNSIQFKREDSYSYNVFWKPLKTVTDGFQTVFLSPDGVFNKVNANSLFDVSINKFLNQEINVHYISSTRDLLDKHKMFTNNQAVLIANPYYPNAELVSAQETQRSFDFGIIASLPGTQKEVEFIGDLMRQKGWQVQLNEEKSATKENVLNASPKLLHVAAHGFFLTGGKADAEFLENPLFRSGLLLTGAGSNNSSSNEGILTAYEVMNMSLENTELVVLSACETALGDVQNGEGVYGLQRAFIVAGAETLIMSLWKVDDTATQKLMSLFYSYWLNGMDKHEALQKAQIEIQKEYKSPYYWGAFIMIGV